MSYHLILFLRKDEEKMCFKRIYNGSKLEEKMMMLATAYENRVHENHGSFFLPLCDTSFAF